MGGEGKGWGAAAETWWVMRTVCKDAGEVLVVEGYGYGGGDWEEGEEDEEDEEDREHGVGFGGNETEVVGGCQDLCVQVHRHLDRK